MAKKERHHGLEVDLETTVSTDCWLHDAVSALVYALAQGHGESKGFDLQPPYNNLTRFVLMQQAQMPDYLRAAMRAATLGFDMFGCLKTAHLFHSRPAAIRNRQIQQWKNSKRAFQRDLIRYYESLAVLALYSRNSGCTSRREEAHSPEDNRCEPPPPCGIGCYGSVSAPRPSESGQPVLSSPAHELRYAIVVVGSGPGGAITACLLAEAGRSVLLIEEGPFYSLDSCQPFSMQEMLQKYRNGGQTVALGKNKVAYVEGRCVGGGSEINSGLYHRTPPEILETWRRDFQVQGLTDADLEPHFAACERDLSVSLLPSAAPAASLKLHEGATRLGWKSLEVPRWYRYDGAHELGGRRQSMTATFIPRFFSAGGTLLPLTHVRRIRQENGRWRLEAEHSECGPLHIEAETLFICGGAVQTPALLRRSGIRHNIGNSLRLHPTVKIVARFPETVNAADMGVPVHQVKEFAPRLSFGCSISTPPYLALGLLDHPESAQEITTAWPQMAIYYAMITGEGCGTVRTLGRSRDPLVRYQITENDRRDLADGFRKLSELLFAADATALYPGLTGGRRLLSPDDLSSLPVVLSNGQTPLMTIHLFSSCPMGENRTKCATDSFGRVHGFRNLFIADASLLCTAPGVNPQGSIMALARRNALNFLGRPLR